MSEPLIRGGAFVLALLGLAAAEAVWPLRARTQSRARRWVTNLTVVVLGTALLRLAAALPTSLSAVGAAVWANHNGVGLLPLAALPSWAAFVLTLLALDAVLWAQHVAMHRIPLLWRVHRMHHIDADLDVTTGLRFHPFEYILSMAVKIAAVVALGAPPMAVIAFEAALNAFAMFNHANLGLPPRVDSALRMVLVTPRMHEVHHSRRGAEHHSNFGFCLSLWDRLAGTHLQSAQAPLTVGLERREPDGLVGLLSDPFKR